MDYWAVTNDKCAETEMGKDSFLERKIFKISNVLSTLVPGAKKLHKHTKKELEISMCSSILLSSYNVRKR